MNLKILIIILMALASIFFTACQSAAPTVIPSTEMPDIGIPVEQLNKDMLLDAPKAWNDFKTTGPISFLVYPTSKRAIFFDDREIRIFLLDNEKWVEVKNTRDFTGSNSTYILDGSKNSNMPGDTLAYVDLSDSHKPAQLRVFLFGYVYRDGAKTDEKVASYIDVNLNP